MHPSQSNKFGSISIYPKYPKTGLCIILMYKDFESRDEHSLILAIQEGFWFEEYLVTE